MKQMIFNVIYVLDFIGIIAIAYMIGWRRGFKDGSKSALEYASKDLDFVKLAIRRIKVENTNKFLKTMMAKPRHEEITIIRYDKGVK